MALLHKTRIYTAFRNHLGYALRKATTEANFNKYMERVTSPPQIRDYQLRAYLPQISSILPLFGYICRSVQRIAARNGEEMMKKRMKHLPRLPHYLDIRKQGRRRRGRPNATKKQNKNPAKKHR